MLVKISLLLNPIKDSRVESRVQRYIEIIINKILTQTLHVSILLVNSNCFSETTNLNIALIKEKENKKAQGLE